MAEVFFLSCGELVAPAFAVRPFREFGGVCRLSITIAVVIHQGGDITLVDAGFSRKTCTAPMKNIGPYSIVLGRSAQPGQSIADQLQALGLSATSVKRVIATHLHLDHVGGAVDFPNAEVLCSQREWRYAYRKIRPIGYLRKDLDAARIVPIAIDEGPRLGFPRSKDLHGDGSLILLDARGHTPGHLAVSLKVGDRHFVHTGDAADLSWEYKERGPSLQGRLLAWNIQELRRTYGCMRECERSETSPTLVPSHDPDVFADLPKAPRSARGAH